MINNSQDDNPICSTRAGNSQPSQPFQPRTATGEVIFVARQGYQRACFAMVFKYSKLVRQKKSYEKR